MSHTNMKSELYCGSLFEGNYVWAGAMNLAWNEIIDNVIKAQITLANPNSQSQKVVDIFNKSALSKADLKDDCYYVKSGLGQQTVKLINRECPRKFPSKSTKPLDFKLKPQQIISYAYLFKNIKYVAPFENETKFQFMNKAVAGFKASKLKHKQNVLIGLYESDDEFILKLNMKEQDEELFIVMGRRNRLPEDVVAEIHSLGDFKKMSLKDTFAMPKLEFEHLRHYSEMSGAALKAENGKQSYSIGQMFQTVKFKLDETGVKVENEAVVKLKCKKTAQQHKNLLVNKPFWIVMRETSKNPYLIILINNTKFMKCAEE